LVTIQAGNAAPPLFMVHPVGGHVLCYYELARHLGSQQTVYGLEAAGSENTIRASSSIEQMAAIYIDALQTVQSSGPYFLGGWSIGGIVAFEMAQRLKAAGHEVALLALLDSPLPTKDVAARNGAESGSQESIGRIFEMYTGRPLSVSQNVLDSLGRSEQLDLVVTELKREHLAPPDADKSYLDLLVRIAENNTRATLAYVGQRYSGRITLFPAQEPLSSSDVDGDPPALELSIAGWQQLSTVPVVVHPVPGNHFSMMNKPNVQIMAEALKPYLASGKRV